jgi:hypothetical protein
MTFYIREDQIEEYIRRYSKYGYYSIKFEHEEYHGEDLIRIYSFYTYTI